MPDLRLVAREVPAGDRRHHQHAREQRPQPRHERAPRDGARAISKAIATATLITSITP